MFYRQELRKRAEEFENDIENHLIDKNGLVMSSLNMDTMKPFPKRYFDDKNIHTYPGQNWKDFSEFMAYENVSMCSGAYMAAMIWKYKGTSSPEALEKAYRIFKGIKWLFAMGTKFSWILNLL